MASNSSSAVLGLLVLLQIAGLLALTLGGIYLLYCLGRAAAGLDRLASVAEAWLVWQQTTANSASAPVQNASSTPSQGVTIESVEPMEPVQTVPIQAAPAPTVQLDNPSL